MAIQFPLGIDNFHKLRQNENYYIDKTRLIKELLSQAFEVNLITRPRRFGKTLNMSMLEDFFDIARDSRKDFEGLAIEKEKSLCAKWRNQWPVVFVTLKSVQGMTFQAAYEQWKVILSNFCVEHRFLGESEKVDPVDRKIFQRFLEKNGSEEETQNGFFYLTRMMCSHYGKQVILIIDEYDVPLAKASDNGFYQEMLGTIRTLFNMSLKTNPYLKFAVITGCLKIAKESIFTGTNHFVEDTISTNRFEEYFGFTDSDVDKILSDTELLDHKEEMRRWYDGYQFGSVDVYCPWDVLNHVSALMLREDSEPKSYWENTSDNSIIRNFIERKDLWEEEQINEDFETLLDGGYIVKNITENLTYDTLHSSADHLWSLLYLTGYLTKTQTEMENQTAVALRIPNEEIRRLFQTTVKGWFLDQVKSSDRKELFDALWKMEEKRCSELLSDMLFDTISFHDYKEDFYHAFVTGVLSFSGYKVMSNKEEGEGRPDLVLRDKRRGRAVVIEMKRTRNFEDMDKKCQEALDQIEKKRYVEGIETEYEEVLGFGFSFYNKRCKVKAKRFRG
ncbi:MAG: AAA family ATPase [Lachnospiraceae bacterium]|nr:AAA family ATPase [Lachnospiraceae bacterium]